MRIVCIADLHGCCGDIVLPPGDVLAVAGDATPGMARIYGKRIGQSRSLHEFADWIREQPHRHKIIVAGNHDRILGGSSGQKLLRSIENVHYLQDSGCEVDGVRFWGMPWICSSSFGGEAFAMSAESLELHYRAIPDGTDVLVCHELPRISKVDRSGLSLVVHGHNLRLPRVRVVGRGPRSRTTIVSANLDGLHRVWPPVVVEMEGKDIRTWEPSLADSLVPDVYEKMMKSFWLRCSYRFDVEHDPGLLLPPWNGDEDQAGPTSG